MHVCISLQTDNHASTSLLSSFTGRMPFLPPNQQRQSTEGKGSEEAPTKLQIEPLDICGMFRCQYQQYQ